MIDGLESCRIEIPKQKQTSIVTKCLYRHHSQIQLNHLHLYDALKLTLGKDNNGRSKYQPQGKVARKMLGMEGRERNTKVNYVSGKWRVSTPALILESDIYSVSLWLG